MNKPSSTMSQADQHNFRRLFAGYREYNRIEREMKRKEGVAPDRCRAAYDVLWERVREVHPQYQGDTHRDDEAESRVAAAIVRLEAHRQARSVA